MKNYQADFPIFQNLPGLVYLDSAATSQKPQSVIDCLNEFYTTYNSNIHRGLYPIAAKATKAVEDTRIKVAKFLNATRAEEIIFVRSATEGINMIAQSFAEKFLNKDDIVVTTVSEHHANFVPWQQNALKKGATFEVIDIDENGELKITESGSGIRQAKVLAITYISNVLGTVNPIKEIIANARKINPNIKILVDASQAVQHIKVDVQDLDCDFLVCTGHKMFAGTGVGVVYGKKALLNALPPFLFGGEMIREVAIEKTTWADLPNKFEAGTLPIASIISLGPAIDYLLSVGFDNIRKHEQELMQYSLEQMGKIAGLKIYGPKDVTKRSSILSFSFADIHPHDIAEVLGQSNICVRAGHHCAMPLHTRLGISASTRVSLHIYNNKEDIDKLISGLRNILKMFKK